MINKRAEMGIGTLIIFIAMIMVAAIAANVLIQTTTSLQSKALQTANQAKENVASRLEVVTLRAMDGQDGAIEELRAQMKLAPGSSSIDLRSMSISLTTHNTSVSLVYSNESCQLALPAGDGFYSNITSESGTFTVRYDQSIDDHYPGVVQRGEIITLCMATPGSIGEDKDMEMNIVPKVGLPTGRSIVMPSVMVSKNIVLYP